MIRKMLKEEWRKNSALYRGRSFAAFPLMVFAFSFGWSWISLNYSLITAEMLENSLMALSFFLGLGVGSIGFSSRGAFKNVLGETNYLVFSSHTLPVSKKKLFAEFLVKDLLMYFFLMIIPLSLGLLIPAGFSSIGAVATSSGLFLAAVLLGTVLTLSSVSLPSTGFLDYAKLSRYGPLTGKSLLDVIRSSGGLVKILFSLGVLTLFYWTLVLYYPVASIFLRNPLLSYGVMIGLLNLSIYNWLNRFDSLEEYIYLPMDAGKLLEAKKQAYLLLGVPLSVLMVMVSSYFYSGQVFLASLSAVSMTVYNVAVAEKLTGLKPNEKLFQADIFIKYLLLLGVLLVPLLYLTVIYTPEKLSYLLAINSLGIIAGMYSFRR
jgi:hypothetical protein